MNKFILGTTVLLSLFLLSCKKDTNSLTVIKYELKISQPLSFIGYSSYPITYLQDGVQQLVSINKDNQFTTWSTTFNASSVRPYYLKVAFGNLHLQQSGTAVTNIYINDKLVKSSMVQTISTDYWIADNYAEYTILE